MANKVPSTMRAWQYSSTKGGLENNLKLNTVPPPQVKPTQHLVRVFGVCLNPVDYKPAENPIIGRLAIRKPATPGCDISGTIITPAEGSSLKAGDLVFAVAGSSPFDDGGLREICVCETNATVKVPEGVPMDGAATIPVAGLTAYQSIVPHVKQGSRLFINGGSGGTGVYGVQIAKAVGCEVTTTCSTRNVELCKSLGADEVIDYTKGSLVDALIKMKKFDHVVDNVGGNPDLYYRCHEYTNEKAKYIAVAGEPSFSHMWSSIKMKRLPSALGGGRREYSGFWPHPDLKHLGQIGEWMKEGKVKPIIDETFEFEDAPAAFKKLKTNRARGKIMVQVAAL